MDCNFNSFEGLEEEKDSLQDKTSGDIVLASEEGLVSEIDILQKTITVTLQLSERDKLIELQQSIFLKGN